MLLSQSSSAFIWFLTFSGDSKTDRCSTWHITGRLYPHHRCGLTFLLSLWAQTETAILCSAQAVYLSWGQKKVLRGLIWFVKINPPGFITVSFFPNRIWLQIKYWQHRNLSGYTIWIRPERGWGLPSASRQTVWCWPPENSTQEVVEFLKQVSFTGKKHVLVPLVPEQLEKKKCKDTKKTKTNQKTLQN